MATTTPRTLTLVPRRSALLGADAVGRQSGLHPEVVVRLVRLGVVDAAGGTARAPLFTRDAPSRLARAARLRRDLGLGYGGALLACELLDRIEALEERLRRYEPPR
jgi:hypothetical protein